jgi:hypothetical protein
MLVNEIKKLLDKAITVKNEKYTRIIYLNSNLSTMSILNTIDFIESEYLEFSFKYSLVNCEMDVNLDSASRLPQDLQIFDTKKESQY